jgi:hypothetical protein
MADIVMGPFFRIGPAHAPVARVPAPAPHVVETLSAISGFRKLDIDSWAEAEARPELYRAPSFQVGRPLLSEQL